MYTSLDFKQEIAVDIVQNKRMAGFSESSQTRKAFYGTLSVFLCNENLSFGGDGFQFLKGRRKIIFFLSITYIISSAEVENIFHCKRKTTATKRYRSV